MRNPFKRRPKTNPIPLIIGGGDSGKVRSWRECPHNLILGTPGAGQMFRARENLADLAITAGAVCIGISLLDTPPKKKGENP